MIVALPYIEDVVTSQGSSKGRVCRELGAEVLVDDDVRHLDGDDLEGLRRILLHHGRSDDMDPGPGIDVCSSWEEVRARIEDTLQLFEEGRGVQLVAEVDGRVVGTATLRRHSHPLVAHRAELEDIVVHGSHQRQGIARRLIEESRTYAHPMGIEILEVSCRAGTVAETVYARLGFIEYGRLPRGIIEPWGERDVFDQVYFYQPLS